MSTHYVVRIRGTETKYPIEIDIDDADVRAAQVVACVAEVRPIVFASLADPSCHCCGQPAVRVMSYPVLFMAQVLDQAQPVCGASDCEEYLDAGMKVSLASVAFFSGDRAAIKCFGCGANSRRGVDVEACRGSSAPPAQAEGEEAEGAPDDDAEHGGLPRPARLLRCSGCKVARYCCPECQRGDWRLHKKFCQTDFSALPMFK